VTVASPVYSGIRFPRLLSALIVMACIAAALAPMSPIEVAGAAITQADHLVISEVVTGGASSSDELIELHNPTDAALPLEGLEVIYVTATGATITRRAAWQLGAPSVPPGGHVLIANATGVYAAIADATYASGMAATGGSVAIRILGATTAIDAAGWGTASSAWLEGTPAAAPHVGSSIERLPGGAHGSGQDANDNAVDFVERLAPEPQNLGSPPTPDPTAPPPSSGPSATPEPTVAPSPTVGATPRPVTPQPTASQLPATPIINARAAADGSTVTVEAVALTPSDFHDGGGYVADASGGLAVLLADGVFDRGELLRITGEIDDRFSQRTLRADSGSLTRLGMAGEPAPIATATGAVGESHEGQLVRISAVILGSPTALTSGVAFDVDDGSGATRIVVGTATGVGTAAWLPGASVDLVGVAGQRDSTGSGTDGYRVLPRDATDVIGITPPGDSPAPSPVGGADGVTPIAAARRAALDTQLTIRGVITLPTGLVDESTAVVQDATGAILLRLGEDVGRISLRTRVEVDGERSTLSGMESLRVSESIVSLGAAAEPAALEVRTGDVGEAEEARLVVARGAVVASARRSSRGTVFFEIDDGTGPLDVSLSSSLRADPDPLAAGTWVEVRGVLGQETSGARPNEGYRIWPRTSAEVRVTAPVTDDDGSGDGDSGGDGSGGAAGPTGTLGDLDAVDLAQLRIGATLVVGRWRELGVGGLLWDGTRLVAVHASSGNIVERLTRERRPPLSLDLGGLQFAGTARVTAVPVVRLGTAEGQTVVIDAPPAPPRAELDGDLPAWVSVVGHLSGTGPRRTMNVGDRRVATHDLCGNDIDRDRPSGAVSLTGVALDEPLRLLVPCGGVRTAPSLVGGAVPASPDNGAGASASRTSDDAAAGTDPRRALVAGLLVVAAAVLVGGAALGRRRGEEDVEPSDPSAENDEGEPGARLTLVPVRHEGGR
jgi:hypothetical protein